MLIFRALLDLKHPTGIVLQTAFSVLVSVMRNSIPAELKLDPDWDHFNYILKTETIIEEGPVT